MSAKDELANLAKLGRAARLVAEDCGLELRDFRVSPDLVTGEMNTISMVLYFDPNNETKPKIELVQMEGAVTEAMADAYRARMAEQADKARREISKLDLGKRGGFLPE